MLYFITIHVSNNEKRLNSVQSWRKTQFLCQPMKTCHVILFVLSIRKTLLFNQFSLHSLCNSPALLLEFSETKLLLSEYLWLILSHKQKEKVKQPKAEFVFIIIIKDHQTLKKSQTFPFIDSSTSILCSIKANNHIFPATFIPCFSTPPKPNMVDGPGRGRAKSTEANQVQKEADGSVHRHNLVMCYKTPFPIFFIVKFQFGQDSLCRICDFSFRCKFSFDYDVKCDMFM